MGKPMPIYRTAKISLKVSRRQQNQLRRLMSAQRWCYNVVIAALRAVNSPVYPIVPGVGPVRACSLKSAPKHRKQYLTDGELTEGYIVREWRDWQQFKPWDALKGHCDLYPYHDRDEGGSKYGVSAKTASGVTQTIRGFIQGYWTKRKRGDFAAQMPNQFRSAQFESGWIWEVDKQELDWDGDRLVLGTRNQIGGVVSLPIPKRYVGCSINKASITRDGAGDFWLHLSYAAAGEHGFAPDPDLTRSAGIDMGQIRAMVLTLDSGKSVSLSGRQICGLKRERDRRFRGIQRARARVFRAQVRQYLTDEQKATMAAMEAKSPGQGTKYARRMVSESRKALGLKKRSRRDHHLWQTQKRVATQVNRNLKYANHAITRRAVDWLRGNKVGKVYLGDIGSIPKGRKKGSKRLKQVKRNAQWEYGNQEKMMTEKLQEYGATLHKAHEHFTSQTCPNCGARHKPRGRLYRCRVCGWQGDRDAVGSANILARSIDPAWPDSGRIVPHTLKPLAISPAMSKAGRLHVGAARPQPLGGPPLTGSRPPECVDRSPRITREPEAMADGLVAESTRKPRPAGKTAVRADKKVRASRESLAPSAIPASVGLHDDLANTQKQDTRSRFAIKAPEKSGQLTLWDWAVATEA